MIELPTRITARIQKSEGCWAWLGAHTSRGYGETWLANRFYTTHRLMYEVAYGPIPDGLDVCHTCDNPGCCNPAHLFLGTPSENGKDASRKGRLRIPIIRGVSHCGAKFTAEQVREIRRAKAETGVTVTELARQYAVSRNVIYRVVLRQSYQDVE